MTRSFLALALLAGLAAADGVRAAEPLRSGPPVGCDNDRRGFFPNWVTGPVAGQRLCPVWNPKWDLAALIVVRDAGQPVTSLVKQVNRRLEAAGKWERGIGVYVVIDSKEAGLDERLRKLAASDALGHVVCGIGTLPEQYEISKSADVTVVIYSVGRRGEQKVTANFALRTCELDDAKAEQIVEALSKVLPKIPARDSAAAAASHAFGRFTLARR